MLRYWQSHQGYRSFLHEAKVHFDSPTRRRLSSTLASSRDKLRLLNPDPDMEFLTPFFHHRATCKKPDSLRSLVLMLDLGITSITDWIQMLQGDNLLAFLIGCFLGFLSPLGSYYDFIDLLWLQKAKLQKLDRKDLFPSDKNKKLHKKLGKDQKLPNRYSSITNLMEHIALSDRDFPFHYEEAMQNLFLLATVIPSIQAGLISSDGITLAGDGTCVHTHSNPYRHKVCDCSEKGIFHCDCPRHFSDHDVVQNR